MARSSGQESAPRKAVVQDESVFVAPELGVADYRTFFDRNPQAMWVFDEETLAFLDVNEAAIAKYGYSRDEFLRLDITRIRPADDVPRLLEWLARGKAQTRSRIWRHCTKDGRVIDVDVRTVRLMLGRRPVRL